MAFCPRGRDQHSLKEVLELAVAGGAKAELAELSRCQRVKAAPSCHYHISSN